MVTKITLGGHEKNKIKINNRRKCKLIKIKNNLTKQTLLSCHWMTIRKPHDIFEFQHLKIDFSHVLCEIFTHDY